MRVFRRAFASAEISVCFSQGFNPHPRLSFGPSLRTGWEGCDEYMDVLLEVPADDLSLRCNRYLPEGLQILETAAADVSVPKLAADVTGARYDIHLDETDVFECPRGVQKTLLEKVAEKTPVNGPSWKTRILEELAAAVGERFSVERTSSEVRDAGGPAGTPVILEVQCERLEDDTATPVRVQFFSTMHGGRSLFPEDILTPLLGEPTGYVTPIRVVRTSLYVERGGRYISPMSRAALENRT
jgi:radical SAM-linked protein